MSFLTILAGLQQVAERVLEELSKLSSMSAAAMTALDNAKADKVKLVPLSIPAADWQHDSNGYYIDLTVPGLTDTDCAAVLIAPESRAATQAAFLDDVSDSRADAIRLRARYQPAADLTAHYYLIREDILMALGPVALGGSSYTLPPATADTLGGVMVGKGLTVTEDGVLNVESSESPSLDAYPVGSIYQSTDATSPAALFGGSWEQIASERVLMGAGDAHAAGTTEEAGLPNITGQLPASRGWRTLGWEASGAFAWTDAQPTSPSIADGDGSSALRFYYANFDASNSNTVYGASDTVQPAAYYVYIWHRVA